MPPGLAGRREPDDWGRRGRAHAGWEDRMPPGVGGWEDWRAARDGGPDSLGGLDVVG